MLVWEGIQIFECSQCGAANESGMNLNAMNVQ